VQGEMAGFAAGCVARAEVEEVVSGDADGVVASGLLAAGVAPAGHQVESAAVRDQHVGEEGGVEARDVDDLFVVVGRGSGFGGDGADGCCGSAELYP
jgi:hypothetical protein